MAPGLANCFSTMLLTLLISAALAQPISKATTCAFQQSSVLGWWQVNNPTVERRNHTYGSCPRIYLNFGCETNGQLKMHILYRCDQFFDWFYSQEKRFSVTNGKLDGEDGMIGGNSFNWDSLIPNVSGTKVEFSATAGTVSISEDPKYYYPEYIFTGSLRRIAQKDFPDFTHEVLAPDAVNGKWSGTITVIHRDFKSGAEQSKVSCLLNGWELRHEKGVVFQTHLYNPSCAGENINFYAGGFFLRDGKVYETHDVTGIIQERGTYDQNHLIYQHPGYIINLETYAFHGDQLSLTLTSKRSDFSRRDPDQWTDYVLELQR